MSQPTPPLTRSGRPLEYEEEAWLPEDFKPTSFFGLVKSKLKSAPLVGVGVVGTIYAFGMAAYHMKLGNSLKFNYWLRWRVAGQTGTVIAAIAYGGAAFTREQQDQYYHKTLVMLGEYPKNTPIQKANNNPFASTEELGRTGRTLDPSRPRPEYTQPEAPPEERSEPHPAYPKDPRERMVAAEFARRLRMAEEAQRQEDEAAENGQGPAPNSFAAEMLRRRADRTQKAKDRKAKEDESMAGA